jgi:ribonuclease HI
LARRVSDPQDGPDFFDDAGGPDPREAAEAPVRVSSRKLIVEADGGSRGNPGPASYGALVRDAVTGETLMTEGLMIGVATNNVAEYSGLIAGLEMAREVDPAAAVEVRMDSKLVVEQMAGRWKIKHPSMKPLALRAQQLRPPVVTWTWVPRELNKRADALANSALDGVPVPRESPSAGSG